MKKKITTLLVFMFSLTSLVSVFAATKLSYWEADKDYVAYTPYDGSFYVYNLSSNSSFGSSFRTAINNAVTQWNKALPISVSETSVNYALSSIYGGSLNQLLPYFPDLTSNAAGITYAGVVESSVIEVTYNNTDKEVYKLYAAGEMAVVEETGTTATEYKNTTLHEMGHLWGWKGHSSNSSDIMYEERTNGTTLSTRDKRHLKQIYDLFY